MHKQTCQICPDPEAATSGRLVVHEAAGYVTSVTESWITRFTVFRKPVRSSVFIDRRQGSMAFGRSRMDELRSSGKPLYFEVGSMGGL